MSMNLINGMVASRFLWAFFHWRTAISIQSEKVALCPLLPTVTRRHLAILASTTIQSNMQMRLRAQYPAAGPRNQHKTVDLGL